MEFSLQFGNERSWIPITLAILNRTIETRAKAISIGTAGNVLIREYLPELNVTNRGDNTQHSVTINFVISRSQWILFSFVGYRHVDFLLIRQ